LEESELYTIMTSADTWEGWIRDIVNRENMDPWNIDLIRLTDRFVDAVKKIKKADLKVSGKFILAAAILLGMKAEYLIPRIAEAAGEEAPVDMSIFEHANAELEPHIPLPKQRKVTLDELIKSLRNALAVKDRRTIRYKEREIKPMNVGKKPRDIGATIKNLLSRITIFFENLKLPEIRFSQLIPSKLRLDIIWTFIPLMHLADKGKIKVRQEEDFGEIYVSRNEGQEKQNA
jgi:segregation and condensation protein A